MARNPEVMLTGPYSFQAGAAITAGMLVMFSGTGVVPATAATTKAIGVAVVTGTPAANSPFSVTVNTLPAYDFANLPVGISVQPILAMALVTFAASSNPGDLLVCAANGQVTPAGATPAIGTVIGKTIGTIAAGTNLVTGVASGAQGIAYINVLGA